MGVFVCAIDFTGWSPWVSERRGLGLIASGIKELRNTSDDDSATFE